ncbi:Uncharacterized protein QJS10_CPB18g01275 [Acorus calamus]|uniref:Uncharacterized protein n=1 Tax=Acorus calamus TaxID=4465 RepID=A0AAV9CN10_ACOCL|nr:Uncharacterized protein QJS10_CPB18g01275 [Acorus calamus]
MEIVSSALQTSCYTPILSRQGPTSKETSASLGRNPSRISISGGDSRRRAFAFGSGVGGDHLRVGPIKRQWSSCRIRTMVGGTASVPSDCTEEIPTSDVHSDGTDNESGAGKGNMDGLSDNKMVKVCDKLIDVFMVDKTTPTDWRRLLAFSKEWSNIRPHFFKRCQEKADAEEDPGMKHRLLRLARKLKEIDDDVQRHNELLNVIRSAPSEINAAVARRRKDFTKEFFVHLHTVAQSYYDNPSEQNANSGLCSSDLARLGNTCLAAVQAYDNASEGIEALNAAELKFQDIINSPSLDVACKKIDNLAEKNELDSALMLMLTKAYSAAKEANMMKMRTPEELHTWINTVVDAYHFSREGTLVRGARDLMSPKIVQRLEELKKIVQDNFL